MSISDRFSCAQQADEPESFTTKDCFVTTANTTYDCRYDQSTSVRMRFNPTRRASDDGEVVFCEVSGTTSDFDNVVKRPRISPEVVSSIFEGKIETKTTASADGQGKVGNSRSEPTCDVFNFWEITETVRNVDIVTMED